MTSINRVNKALASIEKQFGARPVKKGLEGGVSTTSAGLDRLLGGYGWPRGVISELSGETTAGKTTLALEAAAEVTNAGGYVLYLCAEKTLTAEYAKQMGVNTDFFASYYVDTIEAAFGMIPALFNEVDFDLVVVDTIAALGTSKALNDSIENNAMADNDEYAAMLMTNAIRSTCSFVARKNFAMLCLNQMRDVQGGNGKRPWGCNALNHMFAVRVNLSIAKEIEVDGQHRGNVIKATVAKSKFSTPKKGTRYSLFDGWGINHESELLRVALELGVIVKSGLALMWGSEELSKDSREACELLRNDKALYHRLYKATVRVPREADCPYDEAV